MNSLRKILALILILSFVSMSFVSCKNEIDDYDEDMDTEVKDTYHVAMQIDGHGLIILELDRTAAPKTVDNFVKLVRNDFYDGLTFHRIMEGFMIQGGDPEGTGGGSSSEKIYGEFAENGWNNPINHEKGVISMARSNDPDSASCQFFICNDTSDSVSLSLDGKYAAFGRVIEGIEVVDSITEEGMKYANPYYSYTITNKSNQPKIIEMKVIEYDK